MVSLACSVKTKEERTGLGLASAKLQVRNYDRRGIAPLVNGRAGIVISDNVDDLEAAIDRVLGDATLCEQYRVGSEEVTRGLSWDDPLSEMEDLYRELIQETPSP